MRATASGERQWERDEGEDGAGKESKEKETPDKKTFNKCAPRSSFEFYLSFGQFNFLQVEPSRSDPNPIDSHQQRSC